MALALEAAARRTGGGRFALSYIFVTEFRPKFLFVYKFGPSMAMACLVACTSVRARLNSCKSHPGARLGGNADIDLRYSARLRSCRRGCGDACADASAGQGAAYAIWFLVIYLVKVTSPCKIEETIGWEPQ
uniref:Uncharacterized protein n=1 Tax=Oryza sativa subsp. japonica TaxID=39947 RepID=Q67X41_ORYSJ|nr:hypothetical protein [Oryza sativa Japonica Group]